MSPEQARGQAVDARTDVWSFGCVLFEMLARRPAFPGASSSDVIAKILEREPNWDALPASTPASLRRLLNRCLVKDIKLRLHALADAHFELDEAATVKVAAEPDAASGVRIGVRTMVLAAIMVAALAVAAYWWMATHRSAVLPPMQVLSLTTYPGFEATPAFSPDGRQIAFSWDGEQRDNDDIYVILIGADLPHRLTSHPARDVSPAWKPDGSQIAFARLDEEQVGIYVASPLGGAEQRIATLPPTRISTSVRGTAEPSLSWSPDGRWLAVSHIAAEDTSIGTSSVRLIAHDGSDHREMLPGGEGHDYRAVAFSPGGDAIAFVDAGYLGVVEIDPKDPSKQRQPPRRLSAYQGYVGGLAWTLDGRELIYGRAPYAAPPPSYLWRLAVDGSSPPQRIDLAGVAGFPAMSRSGQRLAFSRRDLNVDMYLLQGDSARDPVATSTFNEFDASFSPDQSKIAFSSDRHRRRQRDLDRQSRRHRPAAAYARDTAAGRIAAMVARRPPRRLRRARRRRAAARLHRGRSRRADPADSVAARLVRSGPKLVSGRQVGVLRLEPFRHEPDLARCRGRRRCAPDHQERRRRPVRVVGWPDAVFLETNPRRSIRLRDAARRRTRAAARHRRGVLELLSRRTRPVLHVIAGWPAPAGPATGYSCSTRPARPPSSTRSVSRRCRPA